MGMMSDGVCDSGDEKNRTGRGGGTAMKRNGQHQRSYGGWCYRGGARRVGRRGNQEQVPRRDVRVYTLYRGVDHE